MRLPDNVDHSYTFVPLGNMGQSWHITGPLTLWPSRGDVPGRMQDEQQPGRQAGPRHEPPASSCYHHRTSIKHAKPESKMTPADFPALLAVGRFSASLPPSGSLSRSHFHQGTCFLHAPSMPLGRALTAPAGRDLSLALSHHLARGVRRDTDIAHVTPKYLLSCHLCSLPAAQEAGRTSTFIPISQMWKPRLGQMRRLSWESTALAFWLHGLRFGEGDTMSPPGCFLLGLGQ